MPIVLASASRKEKIFIETRCAEGRSIVHAVYFDERIIFFSKLIHILSCISSFLLSVSLSLSLLRLSISSSSFQLKYFETTPTTFLSSLLYSCVCPFLDRAVFPSIFHEYTYISSTFFALIFLLSLPIFSRNERKNRLILKK